MGVQISRSVAALLALTENGVAMKNSYSISGRESVIYINRPDGDQIEVLLDTIDLEKALSFTNSWGATLVNGRKWTVKGTYRENKVKKNVTLSRYLLDAEDNVPIRFLNGDQLDHRRKNLVNGYAEIQIRKGNSYKISNEIATLELRRKSGDPLYTTIDVEDLLKVLEKGTWFAEWHNDFNNYIVHTVEYIKNSGHKKRIKSTLHSFIMGVEAKAPIRHLDGDTLNNRKSNLAVYSQTMLNKYIELDVDTVTILLSDKDGNEKGRTIIDKEYFDKVKSNGYTWFYFQGNGQPYAVSAVKRKRVYLHRLIVDADENEVVDHINHNTLDNRRVNLMIANNSENQLNRKGARKNSKSGIRGVSWDNTHKQWVVVVMGKYYGRYNEEKLNEAMELSKHVYDNEIVYLKKIKCRRSN